MVETPVTRVTLLARIRDGHDVDAWHEFVHLYGPVVYRFARTRGLQDADAADLMQDVLRSVARHADRLEYDPARGTFRSWLYTVTRNKIYNFLSHRRFRPRATGDTEERERLDAVPARAEDDGSEADWERAYQRRLTARAMKVVQIEFAPTTWQAFWETAVVGRPAAKVGAELFMSAGAVYVAKSRVLARLRDEVQRIVSTEDAA